MLRAIARRVRHGPDRLLHPLRRERARHALTGQDVERILFVCHGNICRSPYAEHALRRELLSRGGGVWTIESAGFVKPDRPSPIEATAVARRRSVDLDAHRSRVLSPDLVTASGLIYVMSTGQKRDLLRQFDTTPERVRVLGDLDPLPIAKRTIRDPVDQPEEVFEAVYDRIDRCVRQIAEALSRGAGGSS